MERGCLSRQVSASAGPEPTAPDLALGSAVDFCASCASITHSSVVSGATFYFIADPPPGKDTCNLCALVRGSYMEYIKTNPYWIHHQAKMTLRKTTPRHLIKLEVKDARSPSLDKLHCNLVVAETTLQDTWYIDEVKRKFYFHNSHLNGACGLQRQPSAGSVPSYTKYGALSAFADLGLARTWIHECNTRHANCQPIVPAAPGEALHPLTRFIDARLRRLVSLDEISGTSIEFIALSYVWGVDYQLRTTLATVREFQKNLPGVADAGSNGRMPRTIEDAMEVTLALGYRYLWVDALCIIQDSPPDLEVQLAQMDRIYGLAILTIVARSSKSSDSGLPGVSVPRDWLGGENLVCMASCGLQIGCWDTLDSDYEKYEEKHGPFADKACYMWRGWTFQEQILSTRTLEFNRRRLVFWCGNSGPAVECGAAPTTDMREAQHFRSAVRKYKETGGVVPTGEQAWKYMTRDMLISRWNTIREHFSTRHFTFPRDRRNAVIGTASMLKHVMGDIDSSGHVVSQLGAELLWHKTLRPGWNPAQAPAIKFSYEATPSGVFPSWSWLSLWPLTWPSSYKPFPGVDIQINDAGISPTLEIRGPTLEMSVSAGEGAEGASEAVAYYGDGTNSKLKVCLDQSLEAGTVVTCSPIASTIYDWGSMYGWCYGTLLLRDIGGSRFERVGVAFAAETLDPADEFIRRINSDQARPRAVVCI